MSNRSSEESIARKPAEGETGEAGAQPDPGHGDLESPPGAAPAAATPEAQAQITREALESALAAAESKRDEHLDALLRARAEMDNLRKRMERDLENAHKYALERFVQELLPVADSMEMGLAAAGEEAADVAKLREGMELTLRMLKAATTKFGVTEVDPQGEPFDPERHQAMSAVERPDVASGTVVSVVQKGYLLNERLVRPALVMVAK